MTVDGIKQRSDAGKVGTHLGWVVLDEWLYAVIEMTDGTVETVHIADMRFTCPTPEPFK